MQIVDPSGCDAESLTTCASVESITVHPATLVVLELEDELEVVVGVVVVELVVVGVVVVELVVVGVTVVVSVLVLVGIVYVWVWQFDVVVPLIVYTVVLSTPSM